MLLLQLLSWHSVHKKAVLDLAQHSAASLLSCTIPSMVVVSSTNNHVPPSSSQSPPPVLQNKKYSLVYHRL